MGRRKRLLKEMVRSGELPSFAERNTIPCRICGVGVPLAALRDGHGLVESCGVVAISCDVHGRVILCPKCAVDTGSTFPPESCVR